MGYGGPAVNAQQRQMPAMRQPNAGDDNKRDENEEDGPVTKFVKSSFSAIGDGRK